MTTDNRPQARQGRKNQDEVRSPDAGEERGGGMQRAGPQERQGQRHDDARRQKQSLPSLSQAGPFLLMRRMEQEMDQLLEQLGRGGRSRGMRAASLWMPEVETYQRDGKLHICADLPGMKKDDIQVDVDNDVITIQGERRCEYEDDDEGFYRSERSYGSFYRTIPLPEGVNTDSCDATFKDGVLHVTFEAPEQQRRRRSVDIQDSPQRSESASDSGGRK